MKIPVMVLALWVLTGAPAFGTEFNVTLTNITHSSYFTPFLITAHDGSSHLFQVGEAATGALQAMAEGGNIADLSAAVGGEDTDTIENPNGGLLGPGETVSADLNTDSTGHMYLSLAAMILPTNDGFVGLDSLKIPDIPGTYTYTLNAYDAGTEANNELIATDGGVPGILGMPNPIGLTDSGGTGVTTTEHNRTVHIHRGVLGDSDPNGGLSDISSSTYRWLNPVARLIITVQ